MLQNRLTSLSRPECMPVKSRTVSTYRLVFLGDGSGIENHVEFQAADAAKALIVAQHEATRRSAELWCDGRKLCTIERRGEGFWRIA